MKNFFKNVLAAIGYFLLYLAGQAASLTIFGGASALAGMKDFSLDEFAVRASEAVGSRVIEVTVVGWLISFAVAFLIAILCMVLDAKKRKKEGLPPHRAYLPHFCRLLPMKWKFPFTALAVGITASFSVALLYRCPLPEKWFAANDVSMSFYEGVSTAAVWIGMVILIPFFEELFFRGLIFTRLRRTMHPFIAMLLTCILFAFVHADPLQRLYTGLIGVILIVVFECTGSLLAPILLHIGFNLVSALELLYDLPWEHFEELYSLCLGLGAFGVMLLLCLFFFQQRIFFRDGDDEVSAPVRVQEKEGKK